MSAQEYRVRVVVARGRSWLTAPMDQQAADQFMADANKALQQCGDGPKLIAFPTTEQPIALIRGRDVTAVELVPLPTPGRPPAAGGPSIGATS